MNEERNKTNANIFNTGHERSLKENQEGSRDKEILFVEIVSHLYVHVHENVKKITVGASCIQMPVATHFSKQN